MKPGKRMWISLYILLGLLAVVLLTVLAILLVTVEDWSRDLTTNFAATGYTVKDERLRPIHSRLAVDLMENVIVQAAGKLPGWNLAERQQDGGAVNLHFVRTTRVFRFQDDIRVRIDPTATGSNVNAESQSRIGKGDLGQNPRNLRELLTAVRAEMK